MGPTLAIITTAMPTNGIIVIDKLLLLITSMLVLTNSVGTLTTNLVHSDYIRLAKNVRSGRSVLADMDRLASYTKTNQPEAMSCNLQVRKTVAILTLYASDLAAQNAGVNQFDEPDDFNVQVYRSHAMGRVRDVLVCAPLDGDMWFRLSILSFILNMERTSTVAFLTWSERAAPQETWIKNQRDAFVRTYLNRP
jgi:hypothetical protein